MTFFINAAGHILATYAMVKFNSKEFERRQLRSN